MFKFGLDGNFDRVLGASEIEALGFVPYTGATAALDMGVYAITTTGTGRFGSTYQAILGDDANSKAGSFTDGTNSVSLADGSYAVNAVGDSYFDGAVEVTSTGKFDSGIKVNDWMDLAGNYFISCGPGGAWYIYYDLSGDIKLKDGSESASVDIVNRILYANDGTTAMLDWSTSGTLDAKDNAITTTGDLKASIIISDTFQDSGGAQWLDAINAGGGYVVFGADADGHGSYALTGWADIKDNSGNILMDLSIGQTVDFKANDIITTGTIANLADNSKHIWGLGSDLEQYWTGSGGVIDPRITSVSTGLKIGISDVTAAAEILDVTGHLNFDQVNNPTADMSTAWVAGLSETGSGSTLAAGLYHYAITFVCNDGESWYTSSSSRFPEITISAGSNISHVDIPVSPDPRVTSRKIYRTQAGQSYHIGKWVHTLNDNTTTTWVDSDGTAGTGPTIYRRPNTTAGIISINEVKAMQVDQWTTSLGVQSLFNLAGGCDNVAIGYQALRSLTTGALNICIGTAAGYQFTTTGNNICLGYSSSNKNVGGSNNLTLGSYAGYNNATGATSNNVMLGDRCGYLQQAGYGNNTYVGYRAGYQFSSHDSVIIGYMAAGGTSRRLGGDDNVIIGSLACSQGGTGLGVGAARNIVIGANIDVPVATGTDQLNIGGVVRGSMASGSEYIRLSAADDTNYTQFADDGIMTMAGTARVTKTKTFTFNYSRITGQGKPTLVNRGLFFGWSLPIYNSDNEELYSCSCTPTDWDEVTDPVFSIAGWLDTANTDKKFKIQASIETYDPVTNEVVPITTNDIEVETDTGTAAQYTSFLVSFTLDASAIAFSASQPIGIRIRRIAASTAEITGEFVVEGAVVSYLSDKLGTAT